jgi:hypothetical protein
MHRRGSGHGHGRGDPARRDREPPRGEPERAARSCRGGADRTARRPAPARHRLGERGTFHGHGGRRFRRADDRQRRPGHEGPARPRRLRRHRDQEPPCAPRAGHHRGGWQALLPRQGLLRADRECRQDTRRSRGFPAGAAGRRAPRAGGRDGQESDPVGQDVRPARSRASGAVSLCQGHAGQEVQDPVRRTGPLRTRRRRPPGQQETAHQGPSGLGHGLRAAQSGRRRSPVIPGRSQTRSRS